MDTDEERERERDKKIIWFLFDSVYNAPHVWFRQNKTTNRRMIHITSNSVLLYREIDATQCVICSSFVLSVIQLHIQATTMQIIDNLDHIKIYWIILLWTHMWNVHKRLTSSHTSTIPPMEWHVLFMFSSYNIRQ